VGYGQPTVVLLQQFGAKQESLGHTSSTFDATFPRLPEAGGNALFAIGTHASGGLRSFLVRPRSAASTVGNLAMPAAPVLEAPAIGAIVTASTRFSWTSSPSIIHEVRISCRLSFAGYKIFTTATEITIPVIPELPLPANESCDWSVVGYWPHTSIEDAAGATELQRVGSSESLPISEDVN